MNGATPVHVLGDRLFDGPQAWDLCPDESKSTTASRATEERVNVDLITRGWLHAAEG